MAISPITLAELSAGPHEVRGNDEQDLYDEHAERARRLEILQRAVSEFDSVPFDAEAARIYGRVTAAATAAGRKPRRRTADLMIAATAIAEDLPLFTANPADFAGLGTLLRIIRSPAPTFRTSSGAVANGDSRQGTKTRSHTRQSPGTRRRERTERRTVVQREAQSRECR